MMFILSACLAPELTKRRYLCYFSLLFYFQSLTEMVVGLGRYLLTSWCSLVKNSDKICHSIAADCYLARFSTAAGWPAFICWRTKFSGLAECVSCGLPDTTWVISSRPRMEYLRR